MLPPKLREIHGRLKQKREAVTTSERALLDELNRLDSLLERASKPKTALDEAFIANEAREMSAMTSGPDGYCSSCGKKL